ncbi:flagellar basal body-associated protein FliL [Noviherbaspirillum massiliense]|uniref:flagellar basal body-associated protein FliL n=1 Tax=Noviherbaspirillum massiliense TaxID=1465823 RepID=UPI0002D795DD|nr:flagellar basal body-associated protein FliL [Noviherbaspirillum massiliense]
MATAPKAAQKAPSKVVAIEEGAAAPKKSKTTLILILVIVLLVAGGAGGAWYFMSHKAEGASHTEAKHEAPKPPVFVNMDQFIVNLQPDDLGEKYLQVQFTLQVPDQETVDRLKLYMPQVRSRLLLLLSSKTATEISSAEGKKKLSEDIIAQVKQPFAPNAKPQEVGGVFFTSFVIQ